MSAQLTKNSIILFLMFSLVASVLGNLYIYEDNVIASSSITIETSDDNDDDDEGQNEGTSEEDQLEQPQQQQESEEAGKEEQRSIQPSTRTDHTAQSSNQHESSSNTYEVVIPDGAAWEESVSERFEPYELIVPVGSKVTWINNDDVTHAVTSGKQSGHGLYESVQDGKFNSGGLEEGDSFSFQFDEPGRFDYYCVPHPWMTGAVIVQ